MIGVEEHNKSPMTILSLTPRLLSDELDEINGGSLFPEDGGVA
jgi:hypothetical protein